MQRLRYWFYHQAMKDKSLQEKLQRDIRNESIAYTLWVGSLKYSTGFPKHENGAWMDCWDLYNYYSKQRNRSIYIRHADNN